MAASAIIKFRKEKSRLWRPSLTSRCNLRNGACSTGYALHHLCILGRPFRNCLVKVTWNIPVCLSCGPEGTWRVQPDTPMYPTTGGVTSWKTTTEWRFHLFPPRQTFLTGPNQSNFHFWQAKKCSSLIWSLSPCTDRNIISGLNEKAFFEWKSRMEWLLSRSAFGKIAVSHEED